MEFKCYESTITVWLNIDVGPCGVVSVSKVVSHYLLSYRYTKPTVRPLNFICI